MLLLFSYVFFCVRCMHDGAFEHVFSIDQQSIFNPIEMHPITLFHKNVMPFKIAQSKKKENKYMSLHGCMWCYDMKSG